MPRQRAATAILVVDDHVETATVLREALSATGFDARSAHSASDALQQLALRRADIVVTDVNMAQMSGLELCSALRAGHPEILTIIITGTVQLDSAVNAMRAGAYDYIPKPLKVAELVAAVERAQDEVTLKLELTRLRAETVATASARVAIVGKSAAIRATISMIERVAASDATILIAGESGTGKELVARALHAQSDRAAEPFVAINCGAVPGPLLESELFGHVRGAFTDAKSDRTGLFAQAGAGTVFLDEIGELPLDMQVKLLRVLQERRVRPVGGSEEFEVRARVMTASNRDLEHEVTEKRFREDLFYRINVVPILVPPLRVREGDVLLLAQHFLVRIAAHMNKRVTGITPPAARKLRDYDWPGNVRELENCMERAVALCRFSEITLDDLPPRILTAHDALADERDALESMVTIDEKARRYVRQVLAAVNGNKSHAARVLAIDRRSLYRRLEPRATAGAGLGIVGTDATKEASAARSSDEGTHE